MNKKSDIQKHFDSVAATYDAGKARYSLYYSTLKRLLKAHIPRGQSVFEFGCGTGSLLASISPARGYGMDISSNMIAIAKSKYRNSKNLTFSTSWPSGTFDYIFMSDVIEHLNNPTGDFKKISGLMHKKTVFVNTMANPLWEPLLMVWEKLGWKMPEGKHKRIDYHEIKDLLKQCGLEIVKHDYELLIPIRLPLLTGFANKYLEKYFKKLAFIEYFEAKLS